MIKKLFWLSGLCLLSFSAPVFAEETLLDNHLELKTERLNKAQVEEGKEKSFTAEDKLFDEEMIQKVKHAQEQQEQQKKADLDSLFLTKAAKVKELDTGHLFAESEEKQALLKKEDTISTATTPPTLFPLILGLALATVAVLVLYHGRKWRKTHGK